jgi:peptidoglycan lytic transglycosylase B
MSVRLPAVVVLLAMCGAASMAGWQQPASAASPAIDLEAFNAWLAGVREEALGRGIRPATVDLAFDRLEPVPQVIERDRRQPEFTLDLKSYLGRRVTTDTVKTARRLLRRHRALVRRVARAYGVDARVQIAVWGLESNFGRFSGVRPSVPTLATLAFDDRRAGLFRGELLDALSIVDKGDIGLRQLRGSWAGALGQVQFLPSSYLAWAVDFDKDGRRDIWSSLPDVLASIANYLRGHGWNGAERWGYAVRVPTGDGDAAGEVPLRASGCRAVRMLSEPRPLEDWKARGVTGKDRTQLPASTVTASLLRVDEGEWLVTGNYEALLAYNCSHSYALSVVTLADRLQRE